jgi:hypothetical protein
MFKARKNFKFILVTALIWTFSLVYIGFFSTLINDRECVYEYHTCDFPCDSVDCYPQVWYRKLPTDIWLKVERVAQSTIDGLALISWPVLKLFPEFQEKLYFLPFYLHLEYPENIIKLRKEYHFEQFPVNNPTYISLPDNLSLKFYQRLLLLTGVALFCFVSVLSCYYIFQNRWKAWKGKKFGILKRIFLSIAVIFLFRSIVIFLVLLAIFLFRKQLRSLSTYILNYKSCALRIDKFFNKNKLFIQVSMIVFLIGSLLFF